MTEQPTDEEFGKWHKRFGVECNNRAWRLSELAARTPAEDEEMLHAAHAATLHWSKVGTEHNAALARMLLAHVYALLGDAEPAMRHARSCFAYFTSHETQPWELAFAHAVLASAAWAAHDGKPTLITMDREAAGTLAVG